MIDDEVVEFTVGHLRRMFPALRQDWVLDATVWRANHSQPIVERGYGGLIPMRETPLQGLYLATMAQIYPEDRGTNYAIQEGRHTAKTLLQALV